MFFRYDYNYYVEETGKVVLKDLPFTNRYVEIPREMQFRKLYSYVLIDVDLFYAISCLELCEKNANEIERQCFFRMAVIQYTKCYSPSKHGGRTQLDATKVYRGLPDDLVECHNKFMIMRNKYYAHDENDFKASQLGAVLNIDDRKMVGIAYPRMHAKFDYESTITILKQLCQITRDWVSLRLDKEIERISHYIEQRGFDVLNEYEDLNVLTNLDF